MSRMMREKRQPLNVFYQSQRRAAHLSLADASEQIASTSALSRFETGRARLSANSFFQLLNLLPSTFNSLQHAYLPPADISYYQRIIYAATLTATRPDAATIRRLLNEEKKAYAATGLIHHRLNIADLVVTFNLCYPLTPQEIIADVQPYLQGIARFGLYELNLLATMVRVLPLSVTIGFIQRILLNPEYSYVDTWAEQYIWLIISNSVATAVARGDFASAKQIMGLANWLRIPATDPQTHLYQTFYELCLQYHAGQRHQAQAGIDHLLSGLRLIGDPFFTQLIHEGWRLFLTVEEAVA